MLTCFTQQVLYHKEKCSFLVWQPDHSSLYICPSHFSSPSSLLWHSWAEFTSTLWGKSLLPPPLNRSRQCKHSHSSHCLWMCVHCVHEHTVFKGTRTKCKLNQLPPSRLRAVREASDSQQEAHGSYSRRTQGIALRERMSLCYGLATGRMLQCFPTPSVFL